MKKKYTSIILTALLAVACSSSGGGDPDPNPNPNPNPDPVAAPSAATLVFPEDDSECTEGEVLSDVTSRVDFMWNASQNTDSYEVSLKDLNTGTISTFTSNTNNKLINLIRGNPYEWFVISKRNGTNATASSQVWRFFNAGPGVANYAPFPAEAVNPARGANLDPTTNVTLEWSATDVDEDIVDFDVYLGTMPDALQLLDTTTDNTLDADVASGTTYYWQVVTKDSAGNTSTSEIFQFRVN